MHNATLYSQRLQRVLALLSDGQPHTTREIIALTGVCAVNSAISELRACGVPVNDARLREITEEGSRIYEYQLEAA